MAEITVRHETTLEFPVQDVFAALSDLDREPEWQESLLRAWHEPAGPVGLGTKVTRERKILGRVNQQFGVITVFEPPARLEVRQQEGVGQQPFHTTYRLAPSGAGRTKLEFTMVIEGIPRMIAQAVQRKLDGEIGDQFERFGGLLAERRSTP